jgi:hypothetical protein
MGKINRQIGVEEGQSCLNLARAYLKTGLGKQDLALC